MLPAKSKVSNFHVFLTLFFLLFSLLISHLTSSFTEILVKGVCRQIRENFTLAIGSTLGKIGKIDIKHATLHQCFDRHSDQLGFSCRLNHGRYTSMIK